MMGIILMVILGIIGLVLFFTVVSGFTVINEYERAVRLRLGKFKDILEPGFKWVIPIVDQVYPADTRQTTIDLKQQDVMTNDQVNLSISGVVFYTIEDAKKVILNVTNMKRQLQDKATSELKEIIGSMSMSESLSKRDDIGKKLVKALSDAVSDSGESEKSKKKDWGIKIRSVQINDINLPKQLVRAMAKQAEAEREASARSTKAAGESEAAKKFLEASKIYDQSKSAMTLRQLQTYQEIGVENNTMMMVIPSTMANPSGSWVLPFGKTSPKGKSEKGKQ